ncbi:MAG: biotin transporter BioY [Gemmatimonadetes bacterium]|nr:biotin transporter BioY [Gemmatimonadota bacterium]NNF12547.1 biotin transporter BioY [Gemmatimonadota bacterium]
MSTFSETIRTLAVEEVVEDRRVRAALGVVAFAVATALSAQVAVWLPWTAVPVTLQPLFVILAGALLGPRLGALSMGAYVVAGAMGAPVFASGGAGLPWLVGPTGGYLLAAPVAAFVAGVIAGREGDLRLLAGLVLGVATMYVGGVAQLAGLTGQGLEAVVAAGVVPFLVGDATKIGLAFFVVRSARWARSKRS